ncbi:uncharacterized protein LOC115474864 [Microcaecilia unicolor]|uniref:Uncharacterized protein LOC115474864 n=1 Tax=Microcaecilia unicolor TaxID=1415580 RepID=A0A6P7YT53_9AMPH|nr:uncharacterized protein LOC115474864 [Microcaecilia unicolor]
MGNTQRKDYDTTGNPETRNPDWMSFLPDGKSICNLSIPGTNNSMHCSGGDAHQHQSWNLNSQYEAGIRFIDVGLKYSGRKLVVAPSNQGTRYFDAILKVTIDYLKKYSKETILMRIYEEIGMYGRKPEFRDLVTRYAEEAGMSWFWTSSSIPTLGQSRGKIIILRDYYGSKIGIPYQNLNIYEDNHVASIFNIDQKWSSIKINLLKAQHSAGDQMYLTFTSGCSMAAYPYTVARSINFSLYKTLEQMKNEKNKLGIIAMDFPGSFLIQLILKNN